MPSMKKTSMKKTSIDAIDAIDAIDRIPGTDRLVVGRGDRPIDRPTDRWGGSSRVESSVVGRRSSSRDATRRGARDGSFVRARECACV